MWSCGDGGDDDGNNEKREDEEEEIQLLLLLLLLMMMMMMMMMMMTMTMMMMKMMMMIIIIIAFKGAIRDFYNLLTAMRTVSNTFAQVPRAQSCANHVQHIEQPSRATCHVTCHVVGRDSSAIKFGRVYIAFILAEPFTEYSSNKRDSNPHNSISGGLGKQTC